MGESFRKRRKILGERFRKRRKISSKAWKAETEAKYSSSYSWSDLPAELLGLILRKVPFVDTIRCKAVCSSWRSAASQAQAEFHSIQSTPWLMLPSDQEGDFTTSRFFNLAEKKVYKMKDVFGAFGDDVWCVGSCHGWLVMLDDEANPVLFNPFSRVHIQLPLIHVEFFNPIDRSEFAQIKKDFISKAILFADPSHSNNFGAVVVIYGTLSSLAYCKQGDTTWTNFAGENRLYALRCNCSVEVWEFQSALPTKILSIEPSTTLKHVDGKLPRDKVSTQLYLVKTSSDFLIIQRTIGNFVNAEGDFSLVCPYRTKLFCVYKLDLSKKKLVKVESLKDQAVFLGGNQSLSLSSHDFSECISNSICFTDDPWSEMGVDYLYGGHDFGLFNLDDEEISQFTILIWRNYFTVLCVCFFFLKEIVIVHNFIIYYCLTVHMY
ncbi:hypothetical protein ACB092_11G238700 [Castanea dentata]